METQEWLFRVEALASPVLRDHCLTLVDLEWGREGRRRVLRFFIDKTPKVGVEDKPGEPEKGQGMESGRLERVSIADCQRFSHEIGDLLDASGLIPESYDLEVSSPGLNRELRKEREFQWATGKRIRCWLSGAIAGRTELTGYLRGLTEDRITLEEPGGRVYELPRGLVSKARLELDLF
jgi:ribosome maturation factor RimP